MIFQKLWIQKASLAETALEGLVEKAHVLLVSILMSKSASRTLGKRRISLGGVVGIVRSGS